jgi:hypothetical protein
LTRPPSEAVDPLFFPKQCGQSANGYREPPRFVLAEIEIALGARNGAGLLRAVLALAFQLDATKTRENPCDGKS